MNLLYVGNYPDRAGNIHPSYHSYKHVNPVLKAFEKHLTSEEAHNVIHGYRRSDFSLEALVSDYKRGEIHKHPIIKDEHYQRALEETRTRFAPPKEYRPVSFPDLRYYPWTLPTSAEAPYSAMDYWKKYVSVKYKLGMISNQRITFHNLYNEILRHNREKIHRIKDGIYVDRFGNDLKYWNQAHARSHLVKKDDPDKIRMVFGVPKLLLMAECMFLWPLINDLINRDGPMLWGFETLRGGWYSMYNWMSTTEPCSATFLALDWKQFDKRAQFSVIDDLHAMIKTFINFENGYISTLHYPETYTQPHRLNSLWNWMCDAIKHTPDTLPNGDTYVRQHAGIASGYFQTQLLDSMYNMHMLFTVLSKMGFDISKTKIKVQGDDSIVGLAEYIPEVCHEGFLKTFSCYAEEYFGAILNTRKSAIGNSLNGLPLLGFTNKAGIPVKPRDELLANLLYPERKSDENKLMARTVGIAYANCGCYPEVYRICENIFDYLKQKGFSPNASGIPNLIKNLDDWFDLLVDENDEIAFPSYFLTICRLTQIPQRNPTQIERLWPSQFFLDKF